MQCNNCHSSVCGQELGQDRGSTDMLSTWRATIWTTTQQKSNQSVMFKCRREHITNVCIKSLPTGNASPRLHLRQVFYSHISCDRFALILISGPLQARISVESHRQNCDLNRLFMLYCTSIALTIHVQMWGLCPMKRHRINICIYILQHRRVCCSLALSREQHTL